MTQTTAAATLSFVGKCPRCHTGVAAAWTWDDAGQARHQLRCPACQTWTVLNVVSAALGKRECGAYCEDGVGRFCKCQCGGTRHGLTWRIK